MTTLKSMMGSSKYLLLTFNGKGRKIQMMPEKDHHGFGFGARGANPPHDHGPAAHGANVVASARGR
jgi:hypothetical protein